MAYGAVTRHLQQRVYNLEARVEELEEALRPFSHLALAVGLSNGRDDPIDPCRIVTVPVESGALLLAEAVLQKPAQK